MPTNRKTRFAECHPDRKHRCRGMCLQCYRRVQSAEDAQRYPERSKRRWREWANKNASTIYFRNVLKKYGLTREAYDELARRQCGLCAICGTDDPGGRPRRDGARLFHVDHCHATGRVRGLLCFQCNNGLGAFRDSPEFLRKAAEYVTLPVCEKGV